MADLPDSKLQAKHEYSQLLRMHERLLAQLQRVRDELTSPGTVSLLKEIKTRTGTTPELGDVMSAVEEAIRALTLSESRSQKAVVDTPESLEVEGIPNLPAHLQRFLAERAALPGFSYDVVQDEVRGWVVRWKEYTVKGTVRGYGQFYERPYAWLEE